MRTPHGSRPLRPALWMEALEDRTTPTQVFNPALPLQPQVDAGLIMGDRVTVALQPGVSTATLSSAPFAQSVRPIGFGMYSVRLTPGTDLGGAIANLGARPGVAFAEADVILRGSRVPNDPEYGQQYGYERIGAPLVWTRNTGNPAFVVGVIDSGIDYNHPDLAANIWTNPGEIPGNGIDDDGNGFIDDVRGWDFFDDDNDPMDSNGHGTHVGGTIGAVGNNGIGVTGVNWNVKLMPLRFSGPDNSGPTSAAIASLNYALMMGVKLSNNSYGGPGTSQAEALAVAAAQSAGHIFVAAAGNDGVDNDFNPSFPANFSLQFDNVVSVAATDANDQLASFSQFGRRSVTVAAPGVRILSTVPGGGYGFLDGTSMATPHVAGALALFWGANPTFSYQDVIAAMKRAVDPLPNLTDVVSTGGRLNVANMFNFRFGGPVVVGAPAGTEVVRVLGVNGVTERAFRPHEGFLGGIVAAAGDITGDDVPDTVTAATFGGHVKVFDGVTGAEIRSFYAFEGYLGPVSLSIGDLTGDGIGDIIVAANLNGHVKVFDGVTGEVTFSALVYEGYFGAVAVSSGDTDGDGRRELLTAADGGAGVHVKAFRAGTLNLVDSFIATDRAPSTWATFDMAAEDLDIDGIAEIIVSQGPRVRVMNARTKAIRADFIAYDPLLSDPVTVQVGRFKGDFLPEVVAIRETGGTAQVKVFDGPDFALAASFVAGSR